VPDPDKKEMNPIGVLAAGCALTFLAAAVNADFMLRIGVSVSHLTGDLSRITSETVRSGGHWSREAAVLCLSISGFVGGAATAGFFIHHPNLQVERPYGRSIIAVGVLLLLTYPAAGYSTLLSCFLAAWACGMQNALATRYRGLVLRTTHITGLLTDVGQHLGMRLRGHSIEVWKITTPLILASAFAAGALVGAWFSLRTSIAVTLACGTSYVLGGFIWSVAKRSIARISR
jgi:uncharacterized membrane protein YoaK (UPF0700 family)